MFSVDLREDVYEQLEKLAQELKDQINELTLVDEGFSGTVLDMMEEDVLISTLEMDNSIEEGPIPLNIALDLLI